MRKFLGVTVGLAALALAIPAQAQIKVGIAGPMTGSLATFGEQLKRGGEQAIKDINAKGGVLGQQLVAVVGDDRCDPKEARTVAERLVNDEVAVVAGHFCSGSSIPASDVYKDEGIVQISPASTNPVFTERGYQNVFRMCGRDDQQGVVAGAYIAANFKGKNIAVVHDKTQYGKGLADETKKALNEKGVKETLYEAITAGEKDYSALVSKMKANGIDVIYFGGYHPEAGLIVRQARAQGLDATLISGDALVDKEFWAIAGEAGEGTLMTFSPDPRKEGHAKEVVDGFRKQGYEPEGYTIYSYATVQVFAQAAEKAKSTKYEDLVKVLHNSKFQTVLGEVTFDEKGDVTIPGYRMYAWKNGQYDYVSQPTN